MCLLRLQTASVSKLDLRANICALNEYVIRPGEIRMNRSHPHKRHDPTLDIDDEFEPDELPVEPDEGPVPVRIPDDPEHDRIVDPDASTDLQARWPLRIRSNYQPVEVARCL